MTTLSEKLVGTTNVDLQEIGIQSLRTILSVKSYRSSFWSKNDVLLPPVISILKNHKGGLQLQYHTLLVIWVETFESLPASELFKKYDLSQLYLQIIKNSVKEKIIRVAIATLVNITSITDPKFKRSKKFNINSLLVSSALPLINFLLERKWSDDELIEDLQTLSETLQNASDSMTTFDQYLSELETGKLRSSPPHSSEQFWKLNISKFKEGDWKYLKELGSLISSKDSDKTTLSIGCSDIAKIIDELPESVVILQKIGVKTKIMELMHHGDSEVRYEALKSTQTFISHAFK